MGNKYGITWSERNQETSLAPLFLKGFEKALVEGQTLIHFGCRGAREAGEFLDQGLLVTLFDTSPFYLQEKTRQLLALYSQQIKFEAGCLWQVPEAVEVADWVYCVDGLDQLPVDVIDQVLTQMKSRMRLGGYLSVRLGVHTREFWEEKVGQFFSILGEDLFGDGERFSCQLLPFDSS